MSWPVGWFVRSAEEARDDLGPESRGRTQSSRSRGGVEQGRVVAQAEHTDETRVELGHRHGSRGVGRRPGRLLRERGDEVGELALGERVVRAE